MEAAAPLGTMERIDVSQLQAKLSDALKQNAHVYWDWLRKFIQTNLQKSEFDDSVLAILGEDLVPLHNQFILAILSNAHIPTLREQQLRAAKDRAAKEKQQKRKLPPSKPYHSAQSTAVTAFAEPLPRPITPKKKLKLSSIVRVGTAPPVPVPMRRFRDPNGFLRPIVQRAPRILLPQSNTDPQLALASPELAVVRQRMHRIAAENGLSDVAHESTNLMMTALEYYLKDVLSACDPAIRTETDGGGHAQSSRSINAQDLLAAIQTNPYILGDELAVSRERVMAYSSFYPFPKEPAL